MTTLSSHVSPYTSTERLPADPPAEATCPTCDAETVLEVDDWGDVTECDACRAVRSTLHVLDEDGQVRFVRDLEDDLDWTARRLRGVMARG